MHPPSCALLWSGRRIRPKWFARSVRAGQRSLSFPESKAVATLDVVQPKRRSSAHTYRRSRGPPLGRWMAPVRPPASILLPSRYMLLLPRFGLPLFVWRHLFQDTLRKVTGDQASAHSHPWPCLTCACACTHAQPCLIAFPGRPCLALPAAAPAGAPATLSQCLRQGATLPPGHGLPPSLHARMHPKGAPHRGGWGSRGSGG